jgi:hypothetical protein
VCLTPFTVLAHPYAMAQMLITHAADDQFHGEVAIVESLHVMVVPIFLSLEQGKQFAQEQSRERPLAGATLGQHSRCSSSPHRFIHDANRANYDPANLFPRVA